MEKFVIIDGHAIMHRAFHALPPLNSLDGQLVNAVYGFFSMVLKIVQEIKPDYLVVCFDRAAPTFRQTLYVGYQAQRPKMSDDLAPQIGIVHEILEKARIPIFEIDGYEADDLIGTIAFQLVQSSERKDIEAIIVSGDRDMLQLVNSHVKVLAPVVGVTQMILFDSKKVEEKYGIKPAQIVDYKALVGDSSDNYPGVNGVGPKTAMELLKNYQTLEAMYEHLDEIKKSNEKLALKLAEGAEAAGMAKKLAGIVTDAPVTFDVAACACTEDQMESLKKSFEELGFKSLVKRFFEASDKQPFGHTQGKQEISNKKKQKTAEHIRQLGLLD